MWARQWRLSTNFLGKDTLAMVVMWVVSVLGLAWVFVYFVFLYENPPATFLQHPFETVKPIYYPGDLVEIKGGVCRNTKAAFTRYPRLLGNSGREIDLPIVTRGGGQKGCRENLILPIGHIPDDFLHGEPYDVAIIWANTDYDTPTHRSAIWETKPFTITERPKVND